MGLKIYNTLSGKKEEFVPLREGQVRMYVCGVTVYDRCHVGHARSLITFDVICRYLRFLGYQVSFVRNFTDVDDKIIQKARAEGAKPESVAETYIEEFYRDTSALGLLPPTVEPRATAHIPDMIELIGQLEKKGVAYRVDGDVFFSVDRFPEYGALSGKRLEELEAGARVEVDARKRHPMDFALWKQSKEDEPFWESPWGRGRPGWHIECSAMSARYLGLPFDIHGGGQDLIFPHHENEIAQSKAATGLSLARYWVHNGFLNINQEKMSKSLGNIFTIQETLERYDATALRHYLLSSHYRSPMDFSLEGLGDAERGTERIYETLIRLSEAFPAPETVQPDTALLSEFRREMDDDFNTARALALIFEEIRALNRFLDEDKTQELPGRRAAVEVMARVLGLLGDRPELVLQRKKERWMRAAGLAADYVDELIRARDRARKERRWDEADRIRDELKEQGITLEDTPGGTLWKVL